MRLLSWNVQWGRGADGQVEPARLIAHLRRLGPMDVLCLQEVASNFTALAGGGADLPALLQGEFPGYELCYGPAVDVPASGGGRATYGNLVLSRLPMGQVFRHLLPWVAEEDTPSMQRACVEVVVDAAFGALRVMTTHLEYYSPRQRMAQIRALRDIQEMAAAHSCAPFGAEASAAFARWPRPAAAILCGDFNCAPASSEYRAMLGGGENGQSCWVDGWSVAYPATPHPHTVGVHGAEWPDQPYCCDFIFVTPELARRVKRVEVVGWTDASDHQPVWIELDDAPEAGG